MIPAICLHRMYCLCCMTFKYHVHHMHCMYLMAQVWRSVVASCLSTNNMRP